MRFIQYAEEGEDDVAAVTSDGAFRGLLQDQPGYPGSLDHLILGGHDLQETGDLPLRRGAPVDLAHVSLLPPLRRPEKIICAGINYADHSAESGFAAPVYPTIFLRFPASLIGAGAPIVRPRVSDPLDCEGELVAAIGRVGRHISKASALNHIVGYSLFNNAVRGGPGTHPTFVDEARRRARGGDRRDRRARQPRGGRAGAAR